MVLFRLLLLVLTAQGNDDADPKRIITVLPWEPGNIPCIVVTEAIHAPKLGRDTVPRVDATQQITNYNTHVYARSSLYVVRFGPLSGPMDVASSSMSSGRPLRQHGNFIAAMAREEFVVWVTSGALGDGVRLSYRFESTDGEGAPKSFSQVTVAAPHRTDVFERFQMGENSRHILAVCRGRGSKTVIYRLDRDQPEKGWERVRE